MDAADAESIKASSRKNKKTEELVPPSFLPSVALPRQREQSKHKRKVETREQKNGKIKEMRPYVNVYQQ